jgi:cell wall-associated NlpC family hydrolase
MAHALAGCAVDVAAARARVVACARAWIGTPFHDLARVKGVGVDCAQLVAAVYEEAGVVAHVDTGYYAPQFMLHSKDERLANFVLRYGREIAEADAKAGDVVLYRVGRSFSHAAIVVDWPREIIHAHKLSGKVVAMDPFAADLGGRPTRVFSVWG